MEVVKKPIRRLRKGPGVCPYCGKEYKNLNQHITKAHVHFYIEFDRSGEEPLMTVTDQDGKVLVKNVTPESEGEDDDEKKFWGFYFESKSGEGNQVTLFEDGKVLVGRDVYNETTGHITSMTEAFKNWSVKFVEAKKPTRKLRK